ncbi:MAG: hypothetical protein HUJ31_04755 [Pseudomonadales bacterium]|nr:hypothetical protein [Pseudomonadales bacterium]
MSEAVKLAQYLVILKEGEVAQEGEITAVRENPASEYVENLFRSRGLGP